MKEKHTLWLLFVAIFWLGCDYGPMEPLTEEEEAALEAEAQENEIYEDGEWIQRQSLTNESGDAPGDGERESNAALTPSTSDNLSDLDDGEQCHTCDPLKNKASVHHGNPQPWDGSPED
jgi:hypothetical protein